MKRYEKPSMNKLNAIVVDLDGTLADISVRRQLLLEDKNWDQFFDGISKDRLNIWCQRIIEKFKSDCSIIIVTGRPQKYENTTKEWLERHNILYESIYFRSINDFRSDDIVKREIYHNHIKPRYDVLFVVDDRQKVVDMWRSEGLVCLQCDKGDF